MCAFILMFLIFLISNVSSQVLVNPKSVTVLPKAMVSSTCVVRGSTSTLNIGNPIKRLLTNDNIHNYNNLLSTYNISISYSQVILNPSTYLRRMRWRVNLIASMKNNMTEFKCIGLLNTQPPSFFESDSAVITVKDDMLAPPQISKYNETCIVLLWSPLVHFKVKGYVILVYNGSTKSTNTINTNDTSLILTRDYPPIQCNVLTVTVKAVTDVGLIVSDELITGFPKGLVKINESDIRVEIAKKKDGRIKIMIQFIDPPNVCSYQVINYNITITNFNTTHQYPTITGLMSDMAHLAIDQYLEENMIYILSLKVWEKYKESREYVTNVTFNTNFTQTCPVTPIASSTLQTSSVMLSCPSVTPVPSCTITSVPLTTTTSCECPMKYSTSVISEGYLTTDIIYYTVISELMPTATSNPGTCPGTMAAGFGSAVAVILIVVLIILLTSKAIAKRKHKLTNANKEITTCHVDLVENKEASIYENPIPIYECLPQDKL